MVQHPLRKFRRGLRAWKALSLRLRKDILRFLLPALFSALLVVPALTGCSGKPDGKTGDRPPRIGFAMDTLKEERWYADRTDFVREAEKKGAQVDVTISNDDSDAQLQQVKRLIAQGIDVLVIIPHDAAASARAVELAKQAGVKVVAYDRLVRSAGCDLYVSFDNVEVGRLQAQAVLAAAPAGNYVIAEGPQNDYNVTMIKQGLDQVLDAPVQSGRITIVKEFNTEDWMADEAARQVEDIMVNGRRIDAVIAENDGLAAGVITTLSKFGRIPSVPVTGMDADLAACQRVMEGQQLMTVYKPIDKLAVTAADFAVSMAEGVKPKVDGKIYDGKYAVPYYSISPVAVDKRNMADTVIRDGFHKVSEVYMNLPKSEWPAQ